LDDRGGTDAQHGGSEQFDFSHDLLLCNGRVGERVDLSRARVPRFAPTIAVEFATILSLSALDCRNERSRPDPRNVTRQACGEWNSGCDPRHDLAAWPWSRALQPFVRDSSGGQRKHAADVDLEFFLLE
jgi:hypothetical protein